MFAVFVDGGRQYRVQRGNRLRVDYREAAQPGEKIRFEEVLLAGSQAGSAIGRPLLEGAVVEAEVVDHEKGPKLEIGKYRRRKNSRRHTGHRQKYTAVMITGITAPGVEDDGVDAVWPTKEAPTEAPAATEEAAG